MGELPARNEVKDARTARLIQMKNSDKTLDSITFAGNGEPCLHPEFAEIVEDVVELRNLYFPSAKTTVLSNAGLLNNEIIHL